MRQLVHLVTLGVADFPRARKFYAALGWEEGPGSRRLPRGGRRAARGGRARRGRVARRAAATEWGGYSGVFHDPDGHPWEVAHNPFWSLAPDGAIRLGQ